MTSELVEADVALGLQATSIRVVLADDHELVRRSLRELLKEGRDIEVVAEASDPSAALRELDAHQPDVVVLYAQIANGSTIALISTLRARDPGTPIVVITVDPHPGFAAQLLRAGALGCVLKHDASSDLAMAVKLAREGHSYVSPSLASRVQDLHDTLTADGITARELEILRLTALGHTAPEIARELHLAVRTVETHRANIHRKLRMRTRAELVRYALGRGLLDS